MSFYTSTSFFCALAVLVVPAAVLGLSGRRLAPYGLGASVVMLAFLFSSSVAQLGAFLLFLALSAAGTAATLKSWQKGKKSLAVYRASLAAALAPLVVYKLTVPMGTGLLGFVGISYLTFKSVQVIVEVRDGLITELSAFDWLYFLLFFPVFTSGPIDRSRRFVADAHRTWTRQEYADLLSKGVLLIFVGAVEQLVLATVFKTYYVPDRPLLANGLVYGVARQVANAYLYALYLFFDFAGYSLMAMGASYCFGIRTPQNFRAPFAARNIKDFWNRWHITLSTWLRDFVFMRLTRWSTRHKLFGSRLGRACVGYLANMCLMGAWHGLTADYLVYGLYHGVLLAVNEVWEKRSRFYKAHHDARWYQALSWFVTLQLVVVGFAIFSGQLGSVVGRLLSGA